ncbi:MAG: hypothetical protein HYX82_02540 [Chloroflexi bacterium]|nr:hypothetical protein [Chloroflexota bacterium]
MDTGKFLELDEDEVEHNKQVSEEAKYFIDLSKEAAVITLYGLPRVEEELAINEPKALVSLLLAKSAQNIRFACSGLRVGYYTGVSAVLRSALEALAYSSLFNYKPNEIGKWIRNEFTLKREPSKISQLRSEQLKAAKGSLFDLESSRHIIKEEVEGFWENVNKRIHATLGGLAQEFNVAAEDLFPDDFQEAWLKSGEDFEKALELYVFLSSFGKDILTRSNSSNRTQDRTVVLQFGCQYNDEMSRDLILFAFYIAHRLLDMTKSDFKISDPDFMKAYKDWHKKLRNAPNLF